jgi:hypothetical protein
VTYANRGALVGGGLGILDTYDPICAIAGCPGPNFSPVHLQPYHIWVSLIPRSDRSLDAARNEPARVAAESGHEAAFA